MKKALIVLILILFSVSMFSFVNTPILNENKLIEVKGTIESTEVISYKIFLLKLKEENDFKVVFPNYPILANWFEENTDITLYGYYIELKNEKYFIPVKIDYKEKSFDLRKEIGRRLYERKTKYYMNYCNPYMNNNPWNFKHPGQYKKFPNYFDRKPYNK